MTIEDLFHKPTATEIIRRGYTLAEQSYHARSPVFVLGDIYMQQGHEGIEQLSRVISEASARITSEFDFLRELAPQERHQVHMNRAGIMLGISLHGIEDALLTQVCSITTLASEYNNAITGTYMNPVSAEGDVIEEVPYDQWREMIAVAQKDPTLSSFFFDGYSSLPVSVKNFLILTYALPSIKNNLLPLYREQAEELIARLKKERESK